MPRNLKGQDATLREVLAMFGCFEIPAYQRPYAWDDEKQSVDLFQELIDGWSTERDARQGDQHAEKWCFFGSIVLVDAVQNEPYPHPRAEIVDGQQRLTTFSLLLSAIKSELPPPQNGIVDAFLGTAVRPKIRTRAIDRTFYNNAIVNGGVFDLNGVGIQAQGIPQANMANNARWFKQRLQEEFHGDAINLTAFAEYILDRTLFVVISAGNPAASLRMFQTINAKGLDLKNSDLLKSEMLIRMENVGMPADIVNQYSEDWERCESSIINQTNKEEEFEWMLGHVRMIYKRAKQQETLYEELKSVFDDGMVVPPPSDNNPCPIFDLMVFPYANIYRDIIDPLHMVRPNENQVVMERVRVSLGWLNHLDFTDWRPVVMYAMKKGVCGESLASFIEKLERLMVYFLLKKRTINTRIVRYLRLFGELDGFVGGNFTSQQIELSELEKQEFVAALNGNIYGELRGNKIKYLMSRLNSFVDNHHAGLPFEGLSIEHVLPQTPRDDPAEHNAQRQWLSWWPDVARREVWTHRIANLIPLDRDRNAEAQNFSYDRKRNIYLHGNNNLADVSALLAGVFENDSWTEAAVAARQTDLINRCTENWGLAPNPNAVPVQVVLPVDNHAVAGGRVAIRNHRHPGNQVDRVQFEAAYQYIADCFLDRALTRTEVHNHMIKLYTANRMTLLMRITIDNPHVRIALWVDNQQAFSNQYRQALAPFHLNGWTPFTFGEKNSCGNGLSIRPIAPVEIVPANGIDINALRIAVDAIRNALVVAGVFPA